MHLSVPLVQTSHLVPNPAHLHVASEDVILPTLQILTSFFYLYVCTEIFFFFCYNLVLKLTCLGSGYPVCFFFFFSLHEYNSDIKQLHCLKFLVIQASTKFNEVFQLAWPCSVTHLRVTDPGRKPSTFQVQAEGFSHVIYCCNFCFSVCCCPERHCRCAISSSLHVSLCWMILGCVWALQRRAMSWWWSSGTVGGKAVGFCSLLQRWTAFWYLFSLLSFC